MSLRSAPSAEKQSLRQATERLGGKRWYLQNKNDPMTNDPMNKKLQFSQYKTLKKVVLGGKRWYFQVNFTPIIIKFAILTTQ